MKRSLTFSSLLLTACLFSAFIMTKRLKAEPILEEVWTVDPPAGLGFEGQITNCDLDGDGQIEAIVPIADPLFRPNAIDQSYIDVINPVTGQRIFRSATGEGGFAAPLCDDVNSDGVRDIIIGGRLGDIRALSGVDGSRLWSLRENNPTMPLGNTYTTTMVPQRPGIFFVTVGGGGGDDSIPRYPGSVLVFNRAGEIIAQWDEPNDREVYTSPAVIAVPSLLSFLPGHHHSTNALVVFGSGGETLPGSLHYLFYHDVSRTFVRLAEVPSACQTGGFLASPVIGDIAQSHLLPEVVAADMCGSVVATTLLGQQVWRRSTSLPYTMANPLLTDIDGNGRYDVVVSNTGFNFSRPETFTTLDSVIDAFKGKNGAPLWSKDVDLPTVSAPVSADADGDGIEDIWQGTSYVNFTGQPRTTSFSIFSGADGATLHRHENANWSGVTVLGDADGNGQIDAVVIDGPVPLAELLPSQVTFLELTGVPYDPSASYSGFRGPNHDGYRR
jgi:hypothetical protein